MKNHSTDLTKKTNNGGILSSIEEVDLTYQPDTETQAGEANPTIDDKPHWMNTNMTTDTDQGKKMSYKRTTQTAHTKHEQQHQQHKTIAD